MTHIALPPIPMSLQLGSGLRLGDAELFELCAANPELRIERTTQGDVIVMTPAGGASSLRNVHLLAALAAWVATHKQFLAFDSSAGFFLPGGAMRSPDGSCVLRSRVEALSAEERERFLRLCPDFVVELRSQSDSLDELMSKMAEYRDNGARLGWLIDPYERRVHVYRPARTVEILAEPLAVSGDPELPGLVLELARIWDPLL